MSAQAIGSLYAVLGIDSASFDAGIAKARGKLNDFGKTDFGKGLRSALGDVEGALSSTASRAGALSSILGGLGLAGTAAAAAIAVAFAGARDAMAFGDEIGDTANKLKVSTDYLQEMRFAAQQLGGEFTDADEALEGFTKTFGLARSGLSAKAVKPFAALGLDPKSFDTVQQALDAVIVKISGLGSAAEQAAVADKLGLTPLLPAIREGASAIDGLRKAAHDIGYVMDADLIQKAGDANDKFEALQKVLDVQFKSAMVEAIPLVMRLTNFMADSAKAAGEFANTLEAVGDKLGYIGTHDLSGKAVQNDRDKLFGRMAQQQGLRRIASAVDPVSSGGVSLSGMQAMFGKPEAKPEGKLIDPGEAARKAAEAQRKAAEAERERKAALKALSDAMHEAEQRSADYAAQLLDDIGVMGMSSDQVRRYRIAQEAAAAPTEALAGLIRSLGIQYEAQAKVGREAADVQKEVNRQQSENITTIHDATTGTIEYTTWLGRMTDNLEEAADKARDIRFGIEDIAGAINHNDWTTALAGLFKILTQVEGAFGKGATAADKFQAAAGIAQGVGSVVGGKGGAALGGAASGALAGFQFGGPIGAAIGGVLGGLGGLFGSSKAKKQAKAQAAAQAAAEEAQRQQQIADARYSLELSLLEAQGKKTEALALSRQHELDALTKLDPSLVDLQKQIYAAADASDAAAAAAERAASIEAKRASIQDQIDKLTMSSAELLAKDRAKERAEAVALDPTLADLIDRLFGLQDAATASADAVAAQEDASAAWAEQQRIAAYLTDQTTRALEAQAAAAQAVGDVFGVAIKASEDLEKSLRSFADSLGLADEATSAASYARAKAAFQASGGYDQQISERFLAASAALNGDSLAYQLDRALVRSASYGAAGEQSGARGAIASMFRGLMDQGLLPGAPSFSIAPPPSLSVSDITAPLAGLSTAGLPVAGNDNGVAALAVEMRALNAKVDVLTEETARGADASEDARDQLRSGTLSVEAVS